MEASKGPRYQHNRCKKAAKSAGQYEAYKTGRYQNNPHPEWVAGRTAMKVIFNNYTPHTPKWVSVHSSRSFLPLTVHSALLFMSGYLPSETLTPVPPCAQPRQMKLPGGAMPRRGERSSPPCQNKSLWF